jgi:hypothetical protein
MRISGDFVYRVVLVAIVLTCLMASYFFYSNNTTVIEVTALPVAKSIPKVKMIPNAGQSKFKADISNARLSSKTKRLIIVKI